MPPLIEVGDIIDGKYEVTGVCSESGGMGRILFVSPLNRAASTDIVLKYCKATDEEQLRRFRREVRLLATFKGNSKVVQILDHNLDHDPPYFVMHFYPDGDLMSRAAALQASPEAQEKCFFQIIDCIQELHARQTFHRDIKPQNFLLKGDQIFVSDLALTTEIGSETAFTRSSIWWGTHGYIPPEFLNGGFKHADATGDIFMIGKTIYVLLTGRDPLYIVSDGVPPSLIHIIKRCCDVSRDHRYQTLAELKQSLLAAYDVLLGRSGVFGRVKQLLTGIEERLAQSSKYESSEVASFIEQLALLDESDQIQICREMSERLFSVLGQEPQASSLPQFLSIYEKLVEENGSFEYAETIAKNMKAIFIHDNVAPSDRAHALDLAIRAAYLMNRFAAMDTCRSMVTSIEDESLGFHVAPVLLKHRDTFISDIEVSECRTDAIKNALRQIKQPPSDQEPF